MFSIPLDGFAQNRRLLKLRQYQIDTATQYVISLMAMSLLRNEFMFVSAWSMADCSDLAPLQRCRGLDINHTRLSNGQAHYAFNGSPSDQDCLRAGGTTPDSIFEREFGMRKQRHCSLNQENDRSIMLSISSSVVCRSPLYSVLWTEH